MYYSEDVIEQIRQENDVVDIISGYVRLQKKGTSYFGLCPFHNEKSPSFSVSKNKQMYYCFGCGAGGNVITFIMEYENYSFFEAVKFLADKAGITLPEVEYQEEQRTHEKKKALLLELNKEAAKYFYYQLRSQNGAAGLNYLVNRELKDETIKQFGLGFANKTSQDLTNYLFDKGYLKEDIIEAGLASFHEKYGVMDKFWNRVMFPIQDIHHRVIGFGGRVMGEGDPKYLNSPETPVFDKSRNLYGLNFARTTRRDHYILCEGYMDVIALHQAGFTQAVASLGTSLTSGHANLLRRYTKQIYLAYDSDQAGVKASLRAIGVLKEVGLSAKVIDLSPYKDPDEFMKNLGIDKFEERISQAENSFVFEIRNLEKEFDLKDPDGKTRFFNEIAKKLCLFTEEVERENYLEAITVKYGMNRDHMRKLVVSHATKAGYVAESEKYKTAGKSKVSMEELKQRNQKLLLTWISEKPEIYQMIRTYISPNDFTKDIFQKVAIRLFQEIEEGRMNPAGIISMFTNEEEQREVASLFNSKLDRLETKQDKERALHEIMLNVKQTSLEYQTMQLGADVKALSKVIELKKEIEELRKANISLENNDE